MTRKAPGNGTDKKEGGISTKFGEKKKLTKTKINTKIGKKAVETTLQPTKQISENFKVKFEIGSEFEEEIFKIYNNASKNENRSERTKRKFRIPIPKTFYDKIKMNDIRKNFEITNVS